MSTPTSPTRSCEKVIVFVVMGEKMIFEIIIVFVVGLVVMVSLYQS